MQANRLNIFDLDGTLIKVNSFREISKRLVFTLAKARKIGPLTKLLRWYVIRKCGLVTHLLFKGKVTDIFESSLSDNEKKNLIQTVFISNINQTVFDIMNNTENCIISTAAPSAFVSWMPLENYIVVISSLDPDNNFPDPANFGSGKLENLKYYFKDKTITVSNFYTDSLDDQCLIDFSVNAFMVTKQGIKKVK